MLRHLGRMPEEGEAIDIQDRRFNIVAMHRHAIDKLRVSRVPEAKG